MPLIMIDATYDVPLLIVPNAAVHGDVYTYRAKQLGRKYVTDNWHTISGTYVREDTLTVEVTDAQLEVLEWFYEQVHSARESKGQSDDIGSTIADPAV